MIIKNDVQSALGAAQAATGANVFPNVDGGVFGKMLSANLGGMPVPEKMSLLPALMKSDVPEKVSLPELEKQAIAPEIKSNLDGHFKKVAEGLKKPLQESGVAKGVVPHSNDSKPIVETAVAPAISKFEAEKSEVFKPEALKPDSKNVLGPHNDPRLRSRSVKNEADETAVHGRSIVREVEKEQSLPVELPTAIPVPYSNANAHVMNASSRVVFEEKRPENREVQRTQSVGLRKVEAQESNATPKAAHSQLLSEGGGKSIMRSSGDLVEAKWGMPVTVLSHDESAPKSFSELPVRNGPLRSSEEYMKSRIHVGSNNVNSIREDRGSEVNDSDTLQKRVAELIANGTGMGERQDLEMYLPTVRDISQSSDAKSLGADSKLATPSLASMYGSRSSAPVDIHSPALMAMKVGDLAGRGGGAIRVRVMPENLGEITISVSNNNGKLKVALGSSNAEAHAILAKSAPELKAVLEASRYQVERVDVSREAASVANSAWAAATPHSVSTGSSTNSINTQSWSGLMQNGGGFDQSAQDGFMRWDSYNSQWQEQMNGREERARKLWQYEQALA